MVNDWSPTTVLALASMSFGGVGTVVAWLLSLEKRHGAQEMRVALVDQRVSKLEKMAEAQGDKLDAINDRTIRIEAAVLARRSHDVHGDKEPIS